MRCSCSCCSCSSGSLSVALSVNSFGQLGVCDIFQMLLQQNKSGDKYKVSRSCWSQSQRSRRSRSHLRSTSGCISALGKRADMPPVAATALAHAHEIGFGNATRWQTTVSQFLLTRELVLVPVLHHPLNRQSLLATSCCCCCCSCACTHACLKLFRQHSFKAADEAASAAASAAAWSLQGKPSQAKSCHCHSLNPQRRPSCNSSSSFKSQSNVAASSRIVRISFVASTGPVLAWPGLPQLGLACLDSAFC